VDIRHSCVDSNGIWEPLVGRRRADAFRRVGVGDGGRFGALVEEYLRG